MTKSNEALPSPRHYFVDEAGDATLFDERGKVIVGKPGCSHFFILGLAEIETPEVIARELEELRVRLLADPYFKNVPSMQPQARKTALAFHAKDDLPEVRREVFALLVQYPIRFFAVIRNKHTLLNYVRERERYDSDYRYHPNELYDFLVRRLFIEKLHKATEYQICFARRGGADRTEALRSALRTAQEHFQQRWGKASVAAVKIVARSPHESTCLQVADYYLWALQRLYERREERYVELLSKSFRAVRDLDDTRKNQYGVYYTRKKPLILAALPDLPEI